nr:MFS transporter [Desulfobacula sp.]
MENTRHMDFEIKRWSIFLILMLTYILVYFHRMAPGVVSKFLMADFNVSGAGLGSLAAIYFFVYAVMQIPSGVTADILGTRTAIVAGNLTAGLGSILFGLAADFEMACLGRFFVGLGVSVVFVSIMKNNSLWFSERVFGIMSGLTLLVGNLGSIFAAGPLSTVLDMMPWRVVFVGIGSLSLILAVAGFIMVRTRPEDAGFPGLIKGAGLVSQKQGPPWLKSLANVVRVKKVWPGFFVQFGMVGGLYAFMGLWGVPYLRDVFGISRAFAAHHITVMLASFACGSFFFGWISDRMGKRKPVMLTASILYAGSWLILIFLPWSPGMSGMALFGLMGFAGSGFVLTFACAKEVIHPLFSGMAVSVVNTGCFMGTALMQPLFGRVMDLTWTGALDGSARIYSAVDYQNGFYLMLAFAAIGVAGALNIHETHCKNVSQSRGAHPESSP